jgi:hypothetical protein
VAWLVMQVSPNHSMRDPKYVSISEPAYVQADKANGK